ncbi:MAG TPA: D-alanyl-D-alanine carboxypeptidase/D-alanyl-D-alanine-endopeptidase [Solimonas sp.]|nr:D-alanyl-D-alanine carboxypeptidase/D-alanyl-D-alanine-endopeptidase [Solimonas sp.]
MRRHLPHRLAVLLILLATPLAALAGEWKALEQLQRDSGVRISAAALDLDNGQALQLLNPEQRLNAASLTKLVLAAAALDTWDPDHSAATELHADGRLRDGRLEGNLYLQGQGDATLEHRDLWLLAAQLRQAGLRTVQGNLYVSTLPFGRQDCATPDRCEAQGYTLGSYAAPLASVGVDYGSWCIELPPATAGSAIAPRSCAGVPLPIGLEGRVEGRSARNGQALRLARTLVEDGEMLRVEGTVEPGSNPREYRSMANPELGAGLLLRQVLAELGVQVGGRVLLIDERPPATARQLATVQGLPLREQLTRMMRYSNNYIADMLTLGIAQDRHPGEKRSLAEAAELLSARIVQARQAAGDGPVAPPLLLSGSGLTPENELSARDLVALLQDEYRRPRTFPVFYAGLVVPADAPGSRMREGSAAWLERVAAKTGTMSEPHSVFGLAGYLRKREGGWIAFAVISNGRPGKPVSSREVLKYLRADLDVLLESH